MLELILRKDVQNLGRAGDPSRFVPATAATT
jgi:hypothetical protein